MDAASGLRADAEDRRYRGSRDVQRLQHGRRPCHCRAEGIAEGFCGGARVFPGAEDLGARPRRAGRRRGEVRRMIERQSLIDAIPHCLTATSLKLPGKYEGKVRDTYDLGDGRLLLVTTDR